ncbi:MAG: alpha/beta hydrolase [Hamadaea sp.]|uniref:alpha/beta fold hydrolase n=1 Tax=Hamadaea sp. TaxID=2024425 RepID=UPI0018456AD8|nr:alpha/beta hydrolase [Hamadaea sp.]NUR74612.1 alpha/beta hydrolase [Hamadaea sp.]NUT17628.1 alpha/beta hydrolase [Hamadaea sp.]
MIETVAATAATVVALPVAGALGYRAVRRSATAKQLAITTPNGIAEQHYVSVGGVEQWVQIRGEDRANPVLFVLHGGPGSPYAVFTPLIRSWEKHFTVVQWDRRGVGKTRARSGAADPAVNTFAQLTADAVEVVEFVRRHLGQEKVVLLAGSMGTLLGLPLARQRPDLFSALVCTDMYADMYRNEQEGYRLALQRVRAAGNTKAVTALEKIGDDPNRWDMRAWQVKMDVTMKSDPVTPNAVAKLLFPLAMTSPLYSLTDVKHLLAGFIDTQKQMHDEVMRYDAYAGGTRFEMPCFLLQGDSDVLTLTRPAVEFFERMDAPVKQVALIEGASHFAAFTQPERFLAQLLAHVRPMVTVS